MAKLDVVAHCTPEMAAWLDETGSLQRAGLLIVDLPAQSGGFALAPQTPREKLKAMFTPPEAIDRILNFCDKKEA